LLGASGLTVVAEAASVGATLVAAVELKPVADLLDAPLARLLGGA